jgi:pimeloyl-[acyl-carrier protein] methyl ester esterase
MTTQLLSRQEWGDPNAPEQILLIHGWGMNSGVWSDIANDLAQLFPQKLIRAIDLPGYGESATHSLESYNSESLADTIVPFLVAKQSIIIAWSMGGLVAIDLLSREKYAIKQLILVSSTPRFVRSNDWQNAVEGKLFEDFCQNLSTDHEATLKRFLAIQSLGSRTAREDIKTLQKHLFSRGKPNIVALESGLKMLLEEDKRVQLSAIKEVPIVLVSGNKDTLIAPQAQQQLAQQSNIKLFSLPFAGHAPFISHPQEFKQILKNII